jgi:plasmid stabilization system protein ParE
MTCWLHPDAERELAAAALYYAEHANSRIAHALLDEYERVVALLIHDQKLGTLSTQGLRIYSFRRFPYSLVYRHSDGGPRIYAVSHHRREPDYWRD